jgi:uncharacterized protein YbaR (Trm112 family)
MIQLYCPACENVVWLESDAADEVLPCPDCRQPIYWLGQRKARPVSETRLVASPGHIASPSWTAQAATREAAAEEADQAKCVEQDISLPCPEPAARFVQYAWF